MPTPVLRSPRSLAHAELGLPRFPSLLLVAMLCTTLLPARAAAPRAPSNSTATRPLRSHHGLVELVVQIPPAHEQASPRWSIRYRERELFSACRLGLRPAGGPDLLAGATLVRETRRSVDESVPMPFGKTAQVRARFRELRLSFASPGARAVDVVLRCYDDAVAFRYEVIGDATEAPLILQDETTSFRVAGDPIAYAQYLAHHHTSHEHEVQTQPYSGLRTNVLLDLPLTFAWPDGTCAAITEAALRRYAGMALSRHTGAPDQDELVCRLTPRPDGTKVIRPLPVHTPWRVVLLGDRPGGLLESGTLFALNEPTALPDLSWIKPGKITFHWWNGDVFDGQPGAPILSFEMAARYIDFCARHGIAAHSLTSTETTTTPWYHQSKPGVEPGPDTDVTRPRPGFELERIRAYAASKGVRLWTWVHQGALRGRVEEAFAAFEKMGWSGMMVDFFDHDDQETVEFAESILEAAARHRILIHLHGVWKPTGLERTYPNLMNHEGALNLEYLKWSDRCTPSHDLLMAFTRLVAGPMDYHLGGFRAVPRSEFTPRNVAPQILGTRAHMLAMYVCFDNPMPMVADFPTAYEGQPGFDFLSRLPTWWDETRVLDAEIGEYLLTARRRGSTWYLGALSANTARTLDVPLRFLGRGRYEAELWQDGPDTARHPNSLEVLPSREVRARDRLRVPVSRDGGFVAVFTPRDFALTTPTVVETSCGECQFGMPGAGCDLALRVSGRAYFVDGVHLDSLGDAHAADGLCNAVRHARVTGEVRAGRFHASTFELLPER
ncbi:MAG: glycoside hydrolase family 97 protein [Verrucomicrobiales bacterium]|nr:glycoside hydrolase family 97 protein [Verrucomicrobiales bacterium]